MRRALTIGLSVVVVLAGVVLFGPARLRIWECATRVGADTPAEAVRLTYRSCVSPPHIVRGPYDGEKQTTRFASWAQLVEFRVDWDNKTKFIRVGQRSEGDQWRVVETGGAP